MTDPTPTDLGEVVVKGQRARGPSPFSGVEWPTKGNSVSPQANHDDPVDPTGESPPASDEEQQCAIPEGRKEWNKDAAAVSAIEKFLQYAADTFGQSESHFRNREYGALLCEFSNGSVSVGPVFHGEYVGPGAPPRDENADPPNVSIPSDSCPMNSIPVGFVHTHVSSHLGSVGDIGALETLATAMGVNLSSLAAYTIQDHAGLQGLPESAWRVNRMTHAEKDKMQQANYQPEWVNPDAAPCPE